MENENKQQPNTPPAADNGNETPTANPYIEQIQKLKETTVPKAQYDQLLADNAKMAELLASGGTLDPKEQKPSRRTNEELRSVLFGEDANPSNLEYAKAAVELRENMLENGEPDPFLPWGKNIAPTPEDVECANRVAQAFKDCIEYANGDSELFTNELMRITKDAMPMAGRGRNR